MNSILETAGRTDSAGIDGAGDMPTNETLLTPNELVPGTEVCAKFLAQLNHALLGQSDLHRMVLIGLLSRGHLLLEGLPGLGKTALVKTVSDLLQLEFRRVQFTPDLMPSDILGSHILQADASGMREMTFRPGPIFANIVLADEINRASPKTQSALLEAMQESCVTLLGETRKLPSPFFVLASQNPIELEGTYPLPEAQLDRFLFRLLVKGVDADTLTEIVGTRRRGEPPVPTWTAERDDLNRLFALMERIYLPLPVAGFISRLVTASHPASGAAPEVVREYVTYGASPRAAIAMAEAGRANALIDGRPSVGFEDVKRVAVAVLNHRIILNYRAKFEGIGPEHVVNQLVAAVPDVDMGLPADIDITSADSRH